MKYVALMMASVASLAVFQGCMGGAGSGSGGNFVLARQAVRENRKITTDALIFDGTAAATLDPETLAGILDQHQMSYRMVNSAELNSMSLDDLASYGVIVWPGGYAGQQSDSLTAATRDHVRRAVVERGVGFTGFCAGAFIAVSPPAAAGEDGPAWGFSIIPGKVMDDYYLEAQGTDSAMVDVTLPGGEKRNLVWWGGPTLSGAGMSGTLAKYDNGDVAIAQTWAGNGFVTLSGPHPEAPQNWRDKLNLTDRDGLDQDIAWNLIHAAYTGDPLPTL